MKANTKEIQCKFIRWANLDRVLTNSYAKKYFKIMVLRVFFTIVLKVHVFLKYVIDENIFSAPFHPLTSFLNSTHLSLL